MEHRYTYQIAQPYHNFCVDKNYLPEIKDGNWKENDQILSHFLIFFDSKLLRNDPVDHKYYYFIMANWGERL